VADYIEEVFGREGILARSMQGWEWRPQQAQMARAVDRALRECRHHDIEAPCGTGKTFAYLVPLIRHALDEHTRAVVCTANIALQEQLVRKDLPALKRLLPWKFDFALAKGIGNYLCLDRFEGAVHALAQAELFASRRDQRDMDFVIRWARTTRTGDRSDLPREVSPVVWNEVCGHSDLCNGPECRYFEDCFAMAARKGLGNVQIVVANYHLYFAHLRIRAEAGRDILLPEHRWVVCDEGHEMAEIARRFFGVRIGPRSHGFLLRGAQLAGVPAAGDLLRRRARELFEEVATLVPAGVNAVRLRDCVPAGVEPYRAALGAYLDALRAARKNASPDVADALDKYAAAAKRLAAGLAVFARGDGDLVRCVVRDGGACVLEAYLIDVAPLLDQELFGRTAAVVTTSATLAVGGSFEFLHSERGGAGAETMVLPSPFDMEQQCLVYVPEMPEPNADGYLDALAGVVRDFAQRLRGRTMALFGSWRALDHVAARLGGAGLRVLRQGDRPRTQLLEEFRSGADGAVLLGTASFRQGVDIPGEALTCLVIDRVPFRPPDDPVAQAISERRSNGFATFLLPEALLYLRQAVGRLIRTRTDRGIVVLCDGRMYTRRYGGMVRRSLPGCRITRRTAKAYAFLEEIRGGDS
jgi:ATP-dependent DNA helicase DinG